MPRQLLTSEERRVLLGIPEDPDDLVRHYTFTRSDRNLLFTRRGQTNQLGFAVQLALLRHPGTTLFYIDGSVTALVDWLAIQLDIPRSSFETYQRRPQTTTDHSQILATALGLRLPNRGDVSSMIEAAALAAWGTDRGAVIVKGVIADLRARKIILPTTGVIERVAIAGRARARKRAADALIQGLSPEQISRLDPLLVVDRDLGMTPFGWLKDLPTAPKPDNIRVLIERFLMVRSFAISPDAAGQIHEDRFRQMVREGRITDAHQVARYSTHRRHAIIVAVMIDLEARLIDGVLDMSDKLIGGMFARARKSKERHYVASTKDVGRLMHMFSGTIEALEIAHESGRDGFSVVDETVGWSKLQRVRGDVQAFAKLTEEDPLIRASDRYATLRKFAPDIIEALAFKSARSNSPLLAAIRLLKDLNETGQRQVPADAPMPFRKEWNKLVQDGDRPNRRLYETAVFATLRGKLQSGDVWVERSSNYRRFDSYLIAPNTVPPIAAELGLPATADIWLAGRGRDLDQRLKRFARRLARGDLDGVEWRDDRLHISPVKALTPPDADTLASQITGLLPYARITELLHEVNRQTEFAAAFTNLRTGEHCDNENALLAAILADATNLGLTRMAAASQGVTRDQLIWVADSYIRPDTYKAALGRIIDAHHQLPVAGLWGGGTTSSSDGQFFRSGKRGETAGDINARYGADPGLGFYTHVSDQHAPYSVRVMSATGHEAPYVLDGLLHHGTSLKIDTHYVDTGGASDHVFALCAMLGIRFCPRLRDFPDRKLASIEPVMAYRNLQPLLGRRIRTDVIREHWGDIVRLVASLKAGAVAPSTMLKKLAAYQRQNQLDLALQEIGRIERTLFMLDWLESPELRRRCHAGLNKSEQRHVLAQIICTFRQGRIADRGFEAQQFRASGLNLVIAAIVYWNSTYMADAITHLRTTGAAVPDDLLAHTSPLSWEHIGFSGDFLWERAAEASGSRRPLNLGSRR
jgi:TnpA family transposase